MSAGVYLPSTQEKDLAKYALALQQLASGRSNATGSVTLTPSATSTVVTPQNCAPGSAVFLFPKTANAAAALSGTYISSVGKQTFTITHASAVSVDRSFFYVCLG
jgi:ABC-type branched-subunit amino acid transport system substrate-binding protein